MKCFTSTGCNKLGYNVSWIKEALFILTHWDSIFKILRKWGNWSYKFKIYGTVKKKILAETTSSKIFLYKNTSSHN